MRENSGKERFHNDTSCRLVVGAGEDSILRGNDIDVTQRWPIDEQQSNSAIRLVLAVWTHGRLIAPDVLPRFSWPYFLEDLAVDFLTGAVAVASGSVVASSRVVDPPSPGTTLKVTASAPPITAPAVLAVS